MCSNPIMKVVLLCVVLCLAGCGALGTSTSGSSAVLSLSSGTSVQSNSILTATSADQSAVYVSVSGVLTLVNPKIVTSGNTSDGDKSSFYGLNAAVLAASGGKIYIYGGTIDTSGTGANGVFSTGANSYIYLSNVVIHCAAQLGHGVDATEAGTMVLYDVEADTKGANSSVIATDRGGGTIKVYGGTFTCAGRDSAGIYSTGMIVVNDATISASGGEGVVVEGGNSAVLTNVVLSGATGSRDRGIMVYNSFSGDATSGTGTLDMTGGSYTWNSTTGPAFYSANTVAIIKLNTVAVTNNSPILVKASADSWGTSGANGGTIRFYANAEKLTGTIVADSISSVSVTLTGKSSLNGALNTADTAKSILLALDASSSLSLSAVSYVTVLSNTTGISGTSMTNISGNGFNLYYSTSQAANSYLAGKTYSLQNGGSLIPR